MHDGGCRTGAAAHRLRAKPARQPGDHGTGNRLHQRQRGAQPAPETSAPPSSSSSASQSQPASPTTTSSSPEAPQSTAAGAQLCKASRTESHDGCHGRRRRRQRLHGADPHQHRQRFLPPKGFAGVSLTNGPNGQPIGAPAQRDTSARRRGRSAGPREIRHRGAPLHAGGQLPGLHQDACGRIPDLPARGHGIAVRGPALGCLQQRLDRAPEHRGIPGPLAKVLRRTT